MSIYQEIWNADQSGNGLRPILATGDGIEELELAPGITSAVKLPRNSIQLPNKGGEVRLVDRSGYTAHLVTYSKAQAQREGDAIVF